MTLDAWVAQWRAQAARTGDLNGDEWERAKQAIRDSYLGCGAPAPAAVIRTRSPQDAMAKALAHLKDQAMTEANAATRLAAAIREHESELLQRVRSFSGVLAARVDAGSPRPSAWGSDLHPDMTRPPCTGNLQPGVAAEVAWMLDHGQLPSTRHVRLGIDAIIGRSIAGPARLLTDLAFVSDLPTGFLVDDDGRPHSETGPAISWADGEGLNMWHGTRVPTDFFRWTPERALGEVNLEVRRCAFERLGPDGLEKSLRLLAEAPDPANPPHTLRLYDLPRAWLSGRLLVVENASLDKGGHRRRFQIFVPPHMTDPVEAAANSFGMTVEQYSQVQRAT